MNCLLRGCRQKGHTMILFIKQLCVFLLLIIGLSVPIWTITWLMTRDWIWLVGVFALGVVLALIVWGIAGKIVNG